MRGYPTNNVLIISDCSLFASGLKRIIDEAGPYIATAICSEASANEYFIQFAPSIVVFDCPNVSVGHLEHYLKYMDKSVEVIAIGRDDGQIAVYSRRFLLEATVENLIKAITEESP